jgi:hypothetical protein
MAKQFTLLELCCLVAILYFGGRMVYRLSGIGVNTRTTYGFNSIVNNLRVIDGAKDQVVIERKLTNGAVVTSAELDGYMKRKMSELPISGERYVINPVGESPEVILATEVSDIPAGTAIRFSTNPEWLMEFRLPDGEHVSEQEFFDRSYRDHSRRRETISVLGGIAFLALVLGLIAYLLRKTMSPRV